jgi:hypothetical protein
MKSFRLLGLGLCFVLGAVGACSAGSEAEGDSPGNTGASSGGGASGSSGGKGGTAGSSGSKAGGGGSGGSSGSGGAAGAAGAGGTGASGNSGASGAASGGAAGGPGAGGAGATSGGAGASGVAGAGGAAGNAGEAGASGTSGGAGSAAGGQSGAAGAAGSGEPGGSGGSSAGAAGAAGSAEGGAAGSSSGCVPTTAKETECNGLDDDCNGKIDDVDAGGDGVCDCLRIGIIGLPGSNPSSNFQSWLEALGTTVQRVNKVPDEAFDAALLASFDVAVFDRLVRPYTDEEATALATWVSKGGGFVTMTGYTGSPAPDFYPNVLLAPYGLAYGGALSSATADTFFPHPVTEGISSVTFLGGFVVTDTPVAGSKNTALAANAAGTISFATEHGAGRGVVWGDEWIEYDSEWQKLPQIQKLWVNIMSWVGPQDHCVVGKP